MWQQGRTRKTQKDNKKEREPGQGKNNTEGARGAARADDDEREKTFARGVRVPTDHSQGAPK